MGLKQFETQNDDRAVGNALDIKREDVRAFSKAVESAFNGTNLVLLSAASCERFNIVNLALKHRHSENIGSIASIQYMYREGVHLPELHLHPDAVKRNPLLVKQVYYCLDDYMKKVGCSGNVGSIKGEHGNVITFEYLELKDFEKMVGSNPHALNYSPSRTPSSKNIRNLKYIRELPVIFKVALFSFCTDFYENRSRVVSHKDLDICGRSIFEQSAYRIPDSVYSFLAEYYSQSETHCQLLKISSDRWENFKKSLKTVIEIFEEYDLNSVKLCDAIQGSGVTALPLNSMREAVKAETLDYLERFIYLWASCLIIGTSTKASKSKSAIDDAVDEQQSNLFLKFLERFYSFYPVKARELKQSLLEIWKSNQFPGVDDREVEVDEEEEQPAYDDIEISALYSNLDAHIKYMDKAVILASLTANQRKNLALYTYNVLQNPEVSSAEFLSNTDHCTHYLFEVFCPDLVLMPDNQIKDSTAIPNKEESSPETEDKDPLLLRANLMHSGYPLEAMAMLSDAQVQKLIDNVEKSND